MNKKHTAVILLVASGVVIYLLNGSDSLSTKFQNFVGSVYSNTIEFLASLVFLFFLGELLIAAGFEVFIAAAAVAVIGYALYKTAGWFSQIYAKFFGNPSSVSLNASVATTPAAPAATGDDGSSTDDGD